MRLTPILSVAATLIFVVLPIFAPFAGERIVTFGALLSVTEIYVAWFCPACVVSALSVAWKVMT